MRFPTEPFPAEPLPVGTLVKRGKVRDVYGAGPGRLLLVASDRVSAFDVVVGLIAGWLASRVMRGGGYGLIGDIIVGVVGALIGGFLAATLLKIPNAVNGINVTSILVAFGHGLRDLGGMAVAAVKNDDDLAHDDFL